MKPHATGNAMRISALLNLSSENSMGEFKDIKDREKA